MSKILRILVLLNFLICVAVFQVFGQNTSLPFVVRYPGSPEPPKGNMEPIHRSDEYTAKIQLPDGVNAQNILNKATKSNIIGSIIMISINNLRSPFSSSFSNDDCDKKDEDFGIKVILSS